MSGTSATLNGDAGNDLLVLSTNGGSLTHNRFGADAGYVSRFDFDSAAAGGSADDVLVASDRGGDRLIGNAGGDRLIGGTAADELFGGDGDDRIDSADGVADRVSCGAGADTLFSDPLDLIEADCERPAAPGGDGTGGDGDPGRPDGGTSPDTTAPVVSSFTASPKRFCAARGTKFRWTASEAGSVTITLARKSGGRYRDVGAITRAGLPAGDGTLRVRRRVGARKLKRGAYRATLVATDGAGNASAPRSVRLRVV